MCIEKVEIYTLSSTGNPMQYFNSCFPGREHCHAIYHYSTNRSRVAGRNKLLFKYHLDDK